MSPTQEFLYTCTCREDADPNENYCFSDTFLEGNVSQVWVCCKRKGLEIIHFKITKTWSICFDVFTWVTKSLKVWFSAEIVPRSQGITGDKCIDCFTTKNPWISLRLGWSWTWTDPLRGSSTRRWMPCHSWTAVACAVGQHDNKRTEKGVWNEAIVGEVEGAKFVL